MSEVWYETHSWGERIRKVEVERHTATSVWIKEKRRSRLGTYHSYFPSWQEAKAHLLRAAEYKLDSARLALQRAQGEHGNIAGMKEPANA
jgi:hypothetical protein